jgi:HEAT repeat protein
MFDNKKQLNALLEDPTFRRAFLADYVQEILAAQIRVIREHRSLTQEQLGEAAEGMSQVQISRLENPDYSGASVNSLKRLAQAFDVGLIIRYAPFSEFVDWVVNQSPERLVPPSFLEEQSRLRETPVADTLIDKWENRINAAKALASLGDSRGISGMVNELTHANFLVRQIAAEELGRFGDPGAVSGLIRALEDSEGWVGKTAAESLGKIGDSRAIPALAHALENDFALLRISAAEALGKLGDSRGVPALIKELDHPNIEVGLSASEALKSQSHPN